MFCGIIIYSKCSYFVGHLNYILKCQCIISKLLIINVYKFEMHKIFAHEIEYIERSYYI